MKKIEEYKNCFDFPVYECRTCEYGWGGYRHPNKCPDCTDNRNWIPANELVKRTLENRRERFNNKEE